jgi:hypothetical protein
MISKIKTLLILLLVGLMALLLTSCSGGSTTDLTTDTGESEEVVVETTEEEQVAEESETQSEATAETSTREDNQPEDVPLMPGNRNLSVTSDGSNMSYEVDGTIDDVVSFYQLELENLGWELTRSPDNAYSNFGSMSRTNANGDRVTFSLQHNPVGQFTVVRIVLLRAPED